MLKKIAGLLTVVSTSLLTFAPLALSAQSSGDTARSARPLNLRAPEERTIRPHEKQTYTVTLDSGTFLQGTVSPRKVDVSVEMAGPDGHWIWTADAGGVGAAEPILLSATTRGVYRITVTVFPQSKTDTASGQYTIAVTDLWSAERYAAHRDSIARWIRRNAIPLKSIDAESDFADLQPFKRALAGVTVVGLGEASHGSRELFLAKSRMVRFLVTEMGFRMLAMELDYPATLAIDDYVRGRTNDTSFVLKIWDTEEVRAMLHWVRAYNAGRPERGMVRIVGMDDQDRTRGDDRMLAYLKRVAPERVPVATTMFSDTTFPPRVLDAQRDIELQNEYVDLLTFFELNGARLIMRSSVAEYNAMLELARAFVEPGAVWGRESAKNLAEHNELMADNFRRALDAMPAGTKAIVWAHNAHLQKLSTGDLQPEGYFLRGLCGQRYYALASTFYEGEYQAHDYTARWALRVYKTLPAPGEAMEAYLTEAGPGQFVIDLRSTPKTDAIAKWLRTPHPTRVIGVATSPAFELGSLPVVRPGEAYDGVLFVRHSTRARPTPRMQAESPVPSDSSRAKH